MNNAMLMFPLDQWKDTLRALNRMIVRFSPSYESMVHRFLKRSPARTKLERVLMGLLWPLSLSFDQLKIKFYKEIKKKNRKSHASKLSITMEKEYIPLLNSNCQPLPRWSNGSETLTFSSNWFWRSRFECPWSKFQKSLFYLCGAYS